MIRYWWPFLDSFLLQPISRQTCRRNHLFYYFARTSTLRWQGIRHRPGAFPRAQVLGEHLRWIDSDEQPAALRQHLAFFIEDPGYIHVLAPAHRAFAPLSYQTLA